MKQESKHPKTMWSLWLWVTAAFLLIIGAWFTLITISKNHQPEKVPLSHGESVDR